MQTFEGRTTDADAPFLSAAFWQDGATVAGFVSKIFPVQPDPTKPATKCYVLNLRDSVEVDGEEWDRVSVGNMAGFKMALDAMKLDGLRLKDFVTITCEGVKKAKKDGYSDRVNFHLKIERP